jgi:phosphoribosylformylglycinamidine synthase subunit PurL
VSLYNQTGDVPINPTPVIGVLGVHEDVRRRIPTGWRTAGETVLLLGETKPEFGGSAWAGVVHGHLGGRPPALDLAAERALAELLAALGREGLVTSAHDLADGGLAQTLTESALRYGVGARLHLDGRGTDTDAFTALFSESTARAVVTTSDPGGVRRTAQWAGVSVTELGTTGGDALRVEELLDLPLAELRAAWTATLPALFGGPEHSTPLTVPAGTVPTS